MGGTKVRFDDARALGPEDGVAYQRDAKVVAVMLARKVRRWMHWWNGLSIHVVPWGPIIPHTQYK